MASLSGGASRAGVPLLDGGFTDGVRDRSLASRISFPCSCKYVEGFREILPDLVTVPDASDLGESVLYGGCALPIRPVHFGQVIGYFSLPSAQSE